jgi:hypothetical protein
VFWGNDEYSGSDSPRKVTYLFQNRQLIGPKSLLLYIKKTKNDYPGQPLRRLFHTKSTRVQYKNGKKDPKKFSNQEKLRNFAPR